MRERGRRLWTGSWAGIALAALILPSACKKKSAEPAELSCDEQLRPLDAFIKTLGSEGESAPRDSLVVVDEPPRLGLDGYEIELDGGRVKIGMSSASTSDLPSLVGELTGTRTRLEQVHRALHPGQTASDIAVRVSIRPREQWRDVAVLFEAFGKAGFQRVGLVFIGKSTLSPPAQTPLSRWFEQHPGESQKSGAWSNPVEGPGRAFLRCPAVVTSILSTSGKSIDPEQRTRMLADVPADVRKCGCSVAVEEVKAALWNEYGRYQGAPTLTHTVLVGKTGAADVFEVKASASDTWGTTAGRVIDASAKHVPLVLGATTPP